MSNTFTSRSVKVLNLSDEDFGTLLDALAEMSERSPDAKRFMTLHNAICGMAGRLKIDKDEPFRASYRWKVTACRPGPETEDLLVMDKSDLPVARCFAVSGAYMAGSVDTDGYCHPISGVFPTMEEAKRFCVKTFVR